MHYDIIGDIHGCCLTLLPCWKSWAMPAATVSTGTPRGVLDPERARTHIPDDEIPADHLVDYAHQDPPVFLGHYWLEGEPQPLAANIACLDYSVAKPGGRLVAYRWNGERRLRREAFVSMERREAGAGPRTA